MKAYMLVELSFMTGKIVNGYGAEAAKLVDKFGGKYLVEEHLALFHSSR